MRELIALAPVTDIARRYHQGDCDNSAGKLMGGSPDEQNGRYCQVSPIELLPVPVPQLVMLGERPGEALKQSRAPLAGPIQRTAGMSAKLTDWWAPTGQVPFLILQGANDQAAPPQNGEMLKADLGDRATLVNIPSAGHLMVVTKPDIVSKEIVQFIRQHTKAGS